MDTGCVDPNTAAEFLDGLLSVDLASGVESHMARCADCRRLIGALAQSSRHPIDTDPDPDPPDDSDRAALASTVDRANGRRRPTTEGDALAEGARVGRFMVLKRLGAGGMGVIYAAYDPHLDRKVALKFLRGDVVEGSHHSADARARLIGEAQAIARVTHPNILSVYDVGEIDDQVYVAMEFVDGVTLTRWLRKEPRSWREIRAVFLEAAEGLAAAHDGDIVHRDFKPENVMITGGDRVVVMDFGLARSAAEEREPTPITEEERPSALGASLTRTGAILGTPRYMAPEQFDGRIADARSDQFSFCVALYEALYMTYPFYSETAAQLTARLPVADQLRPVERERTVPAYLRAAVLRGMCYDPADRFGSMRELMSAIRDRVSRRVRWIGAGAIVAVAAAALLAAQSMSGEEEARDRARATELELEQARQDAEQAIVEANRLRTEIAELQSDLDDRKAQEQEILILETEVAKKEARLLDIEEANFRRAEAVRNQRVFEERLDKGLVKRYIKRRRRAIETCYQRGRELNPTMGEWVTTEFSISRDGGVMWVKTAGLRSRSVSDCVRSVIQSIEFPRSNVATVATFAFDFDHQRSRTNLELREGSTLKGDELQLRMRVRADGLVCDPRDPICGAD
jgi:hypothetical protein